MADQRYNFYSKLHLIFGLVLFLIAIYFTYGLSLYPGDVILKVSPDEAVAGTYQNLDLVFSTGSSRIEIGGGFRFEIPVAYLETGPYYWDVPQTTLPGGRGYVRASSSKKSAIEVKIYGHRNRIVECSVTENPLETAENIFVTYSGMIQCLTTKCIIRAQWRKSFEDPWEDIKPSPEIKILPQSAATMLVVTPADAEIQKDIEMSVVFIDKFGNRAIDYAGTITFNSTDSLATYPRAYNFTEKDSGIHVFKHVRFGTPGFQRIDASDGNLKGKYNYTWVSKIFSKYKRYFGDTHFHTGTGTGTANKEFSFTGEGGDHRGHFSTEIEAYQYARDIMRLDFASAAEHDSKLLDEIVWNNIQDICDSFYEPGIFTTFYAYEWTAKPEIGHHVILYKHRTPKISNHFDYPGTNDIWKVFDSQNYPVIMIPHPMWSQADHLIWKDVNNKYRRIGEIYSLWCNRFLIQPGDDTQRFELDADSPWSFQYAWKRGHKIGVIGSTDNHTARPGLNNYTTNMIHSGGLAVALAENNERDAIWETFEQRRTYATSGTRILLEFTCDGHFMGEEFETNCCPIFSIKVAGTNQLECVELVKYDSHGFRVIYKNIPNSDIAEVKCEDLNFSENSMYYVRVKQVDEWWKGAWAYPSAEMAWSSPIWVNYAR